MDHLFGAEQRRRAAFAAIIHRLAIVANGDIGLIGVGGGGEE